MNLEPGIDRLNKRDDPDVLDDGGVNATIDRFTEEQQRLLELGGLDERVESEIDSHTAGMRKPARCLQLVESQLCSFIPRVEPLGAEVYGVSAIGDSGPHRLE